LELARDDEACAHGAAGPDLAAAILTALRLGRSNIADSAALLAEEAFVRERVMRLLQPMTIDAPAERNLTPILIMLALAIPIATLVGLKFGERLIGSLLTGA
jgi:hypothetical protein